MSMFFSEWVRHELGNPAFAIETNLEPLKRRIMEGRTEEAIAIVDSIQASVERIKQSLDEYF
jgi:hypothetical protein